MSRVPVVLQRAGTELPLPHEGGRSWAGSGSILAVTLHKPVPLVRVAPGSSHRVQCPGVRNQERMARDSNGLAETCYSN